MSISPPAPVGDVTSTSTHCPYCALQCAMSLTPTADGAPTPVEVRPRDFPTNRGGLCRKGWTAASVLNVGDRVTTPLLRGSDGRLAPASWDAAYERIVTQVRAAQAAGGPDAVAIFGGGGLTNEKAYALGKFARAVLRTSRIDYNGRFCMSSAAAAGNRAFGLDRGLPFPLEDLGGADAVLLAGSNPSDTMPPAVQHLMPVRERGGLIVIDPRRSATAALADEGGGVHLQAEPGTDGAVLAGLLHLVVAAGAEDGAYLDERVTGWAEVRQAIALWWPERVERGAGVPVERLRAAAELLIRASPSAGGAGAYVLTGRGAEQHAHGTDTVTAAINLALALGLVGRRGSGYGCITGQGNGQGGREHGQKADQLPGYRSITDPAARAHVARVWGVDPAELPGPGVPAMELIWSLGAEGGPSVLFVHGSNLVISAPDAAAVTRRLEALDLLVVCDFVLSETAAMADVVLPVPQWAEEEGTMTSLEGRVLRRRRALTAPGQTRDELQVLADLARLLGSPVVMRTDPRDVFEELGEASRGGRADYSGISYARLDAGEALHWPCPGADHPGTPRLFLDGFPTPDGRARMTVVHPGRADDETRPDAPLYLVTGRLLGHYQSGAQTRRVAELSRAHPHLTVQVNPQTAARLGLEEGVPATLRSSRGEATATVVLSPDIRPDTVFLPFHFAGNERANLLTNPVADPISGMPEFKVCAVSLESLPEVR
ncbi:molybdopterin oxidoreductase family protein [Actinomycetota bacterium]